MTAGLIKRRQDAEAEGTGNTPDGRPVVKRVQIAKTQRPHAPVEIDLRTPSGRVLPF